MGDNQKKAPIGKTKALFDFTAENDGELSFKTDDIIWVLDKDDVGEWDGWWEGRCERTQQEGFFPADGWVEELPFTPGGDSIQKPALPTAPKPAIKGRMSTNAPSALSSENLKESSAAAAPPATPAAPAAQPSAAEMSPRKMENGSAAEKKLPEVPSSPTTTTISPSSSDSTPTTATTTTTTTPNKKENNKKNNKKDKNNKNNKDEKSKEEKAAAKEERRAKKEKEREEKEKQRKEKPKPKRKAPRKGREVELGDPYGFKKLGGFERRAGQCPEEQIAKMYNQSAEELVAMLDSQGDTPHTADATTKDAGTSAPTSNPKDNKDNNSSGHNKKEKDKKKGKDPVKEEKKKAEEEAKKKDKEDKKKAKEDAKKNNKEEGSGSLGKKKGSQKISKIVGGSKKDKEDKKDSHHHDEAKEKPSSPRDNKEEPAKEEVPPPPSRIVKPAPASNNPNPGQHPQPAKILPVNTGEPLLDFLTTLKLESLHPIFKAEEMEFPDDFIGISHEELTSLDIKMGPR